MHFRITSQKTLPMEVAEHGVFDVHDFAFKRVVKIDFERFISGRERLGFVHD